MSRPHRAKTPKRGSGFEPTSSAGLPGAHRAYRRGGLVVLSSIADMELPQSGGRVGATWLISVSDRGGRASAKAVRSALRAFGMRHAEEDNHEPGIARKFFMPVEPRWRNVCECKLNEEQVIEPDGYTWSRLVAGAATDGG